MAGLGIRKYYGEFQVVPAALHANLDRCGYNCAYCFVNEQRTKTTDKTESNDIPKTVAAWRKHLQTRTGWVGDFIRTKKIVVLSNTSDFFSPKVFNDSLPLVNAMMEEGLPMWYQTRGGPQALAWAKNAPKATWLVSITSDNKALTGEVESITPGPQARMKLCEDLKALGHTVVASVNPYIPDWWQDLPAFLKWAERTGIDGLWVQTLHLSSLYKSKADEDTWRRLQPILSAKKTKKQARLLYPELEKLFTCDVPLFNGFSSDCQFAKNVCKPYAPSSIIPTIYDFWRDIPIGSEVTIDDFVNFFEPHLPDVIDKTTNEYVKVFCRAGFKGDDERKYTIHTRRQLLETLWNNPWEVPSVPWRTQHMACRCTIDANGKFDYDPDSEGNVVGIRTRYRQPFEFVPGLHDANKRTELEPD